MRLYIIKGTLWFQARLSYKEFVSILRLGGGAGFPLSLGSLETWADQLEEKGRIPALFAMIVKPVEIPVIGILNSRRIQKRNITPDTLTDFLSMEQAGRILADFFTCNIQSIGQFMNRKIGGGVFSKKRVTVLEAIIFLMTYSSTYRMAQSLKQNGLDLSPQK